MTNNETLPHNSGDSHLAPDISVVIVNWNLSELLHGCLDSLRSFGDGVVVECIVVDNGSSDGSVAMLERDFPEVTLIRNTGNSGFSRASNQGMKAASGRYMFLLNNDCLLEEGALQRMVSYMDSHPEAGACGPRVVNSDGTLQVHSKGYYPTILRIMVKMFMPERIKNTWGLSSGIYEYNDKKEIQEYDWLSGCALMVRRQVVDEVGYLDADVFMYCEDIDWCYRIGKSGWKVMYLPMAQVLHFGGQSMLMQQGAIVGSHAAGLVAYYSRYHKHSAALLFRMILTAGYAVQAAGWIIGGLFGRRTGMDKLRRISSRRRADSGK